MFHEFWWALGPFRLHFEWFAMTPGTVSCAKFWYSPKTAHTRHNAEHLQAEHQQRPCKKLLRNKASTERAQNLQGPSKKLAMNTKNLPRTRRKFAQATTRNHKRHIAYIKATATATNAALYNQWWWCARRQAHSDVRYEFWMIYVIWDEIWEWSYEIWDMGNAMEL